MPTVSNRNLISLFELELRRLLVEIAYQPLLYFSEKTLQFRLSARLLQLTEFSQPIPTCVYDHNKDAFDRIVKDELKKERSISTTHEGLLSVPPLQMEYGNNNLPNAQLDLAILDPEDIPSIASSDTFQDSSGSYLTPLIGAEFFTEKSGETEEVITKHLTNDATKTSQCKNGYVVNVFRNHRMTRRGTPRSAETDTKLDRFRRQVSAHAEQHETVTWIGMIIHIAFADIELFAKTGEWKPIDLMSERSRVEDEFLAMLPTRQANDLQSS